MTENSTGLILRTRPLTETSLIVAWLTPDLGRIDTVAKGARRPKSTFAGKLDLFYGADFSFQRSRRSELHALREVSLRETDSGLRREMEYVEQAAYGAALIEQATEKESPVPEIFELFQGFLKFLPTQPPQPQSILAFEIKLLEELGLRPGGEESRLNPGLEQIIKAFRENDWPGLSRIKLSAVQMAALTRFLGGFMVFHLERVPALRSTVVR